MSTLPVVCLMGPTASGKTELAVTLAEMFPMDIVSVDSALVYRDMDIGTAKPDDQILSKAPHRLIDIRDPEESYSAGSFVRDAREQIDLIHASGRIPLLVGGTMLYFRSLIGGIADLPEADDAVRAEIDAEAVQSGWAAMHDQLRQVDPESAARINANDKQRIQRALEVFRISGRSLTDWHSDAAASQDNYDFIKIALIPESRADLHERINARFINMLEMGFVGEVMRLRDRKGLGADFPSMRSVGYRQIWAHLDGDYDLDQAVAKGQAATRQFAKRQLTWLRSEKDLFSVDPLEAGVIVSISTLIHEKLNKHTVTGLIRL